MFLILFTCRIFFKHLEISFVITTVLFKYMFVVVIIHSLTLFICLLISYMVTYEVNNIFTNGKFDLEFSIHATVLVNVANYNFNFVKPIKIFMNWLLWNEIVSEIISEILMNKLINTKNFKFSGLVNIALSFLWQAWKWCFFILLTRCLWFGGRSTSFTLSLFSEFSYLICV